ncbi:hypothetical protein WOLCODRAFT_19662 [Wolfiporia cocos MD-104 SS10]|uniref:Glucose-methanol-choline oxidoreductase N-terminal domain-containing protein n=1 Tax=Wolfiporia cocos (strain MD-104) TaxID=742152 RepID=A0A2H3J857_WOLCO|nr:hypothetical protein WOLCODRAFT_19662 [Wolfiporia cocos MD-104 SS10]
MPRTNTPVHTLQQDRQNLKVLVSALVYRILTARSSNGKTTARRVEFGYGRDKHIVNASREVILCVGALKSPHILELSGIGNRDVLNRIGVTVDVELPGIGNNVQEHVFTGPSFELRDDVEFETVDILLRDSAVAIKHAELQLKNGTPGCKIISFPGHPSIPNLPVEGKCYVSIMSMMNYTFSRGTIHSISNDPREEPEFDPHYLEEEAGLEIRCEAIKFVRGLSQISPLKNMIDWIKNNFNTTWHTCGSCSMWPQDKDGVVDPELKRLYTISQNKSFCANAMGMQSC